MLVMGHELGAFRSAIWMLRALPPPPPNWNWSNKLSRLQQIRQADAIQHFGAKTVEHRETDIGPILGWIDVDAERALAKGGVNDLDDCVGYGRSVGILRHDLGERLPHLVAETGIRSSFIFGYARLVGGFAGMREVIGAAGEGTGNND